MVEQFVSEQKLSHMIISDKDSLRHKANLGSDVAASQQVNPMATDTNRLQLEMNGEMSTLL